jgi:hypothetical protein
MRPIMSISLPARLSACLPAYKLYYLYLFMMTIKLNVYRSIYDIYNLVLVLLNN